MSIISKEIYDAVLPNGLKCCEAHIWNRFCLEAIGKFGFVAFHGALKFFLPIYIVKLLLNYKKINNKTFLRKSLLEWIRSAVYGSLFGALVNGSWCLSSHFSKSGTLSFYQLGFLPGFVSGLSVLVESTENKQLDTLIFFNLVMETLINNLQYENVVNLTATKQTFFFMVVSGLLMGLMEGFPARLPKVNFWFYKPKSGEGGCNHEGKCSNFFLNGFKRYFLLGFMVNIIRKTIPKMGVLVKQPEMIVKLPFNRANVQWGLLFGGYVAIYRFLGCKLSDLLPQHFRGFICGSISGSVFGIAPNLQLLIVAITTLFQLVYSNLTRKLNIPNNNPLRQLLFMLCNAVLMHNTFVSKCLTPKYYVNMVNVVSKYIFDEVYTEVIGRILERVFV